PSAASDASPLSLHDALPIYRLEGGGERRGGPPGADRHEDAPDRVEVVAQLACVADAHREPVASLDRRRQRHAADRRLDHVLDLADRKSTRLNSSHLGISYAV